MSALAGFAVVALFVIIGIGSIFALAATVGPKKEEQQQQQPNTSPLVLSAKKAQEKTPQQFFQENDHFFR